MFEAGFKRCSFPTTTRYLITTPNVKNENNVFDRDVGGHYPLSRVTSTMLASRSQSISRAEEEKKKPTYYCIPSEASYRLQILSRN